MSATYLSPSVQRWVRGLVVPLTFLAGAAHAATASGIDGLTIGAVIPRLDQSSNRLPADQTILQSLQAMLKLTNNDWTLSSQDALGAVRIINRNGDKVAALPVGSVLIDPDRQDGALCYRAGLCETAASHLVTRFNAALDDPTAFIAALRQIDPAASVQINSDGNLLVQIGGHRYLTQVGWNVIPANGNNGFANDSSSVWLVSAGNKQLLYPTLASFDRLVTVLRQIDATASAIGDHQGHVTLVVQGQRFTLTPGWEIITTPVAHAKEDYWVEGGGLYLNYLDGTAQAVTIK